MRIPQHHHPVRICIVLLTGLGDVVMGLPLANALKRAWPHSRITWIAEPTAAPILQDHPAVDEVVVYQKRRGLRGVRELARTMAPRRFDMTLNLMVYFKSVWPTVFSGAPRRLGFGRDRARDWIWLAANQHLPARPRGHTADQFLEFAEALGVSREPLEWRIRFTGEEREAQRRFFGGLDGGRVATIVPTTSMARKDWIAERWAEVVDTMYERWGVRTVLAGGPGAREEAIARDIVRLARAEPVWALGDGVRRLAWILDGSDVVIAPDTGPVHIARALETPVVGLYGHSNPWRVGPYRAYEDLWVDRYTDPGEAPDPSRFDPKQRRMELITVDHVLDRVEHAFARYLDPPGKQNG